MLDWLTANEALVGWLTVVSVLMFVGSLLAVPWLVVRIPADYFVRHRHQHLVDRWQSRHPLVRITLLALKNCLGSLLVLAGIAMLVLPGQGILTILVGLLFLDFPGKLALERRLVCHAPVRRAMNWIRLKAHRPPLVLPDEDVSP